MKYGSKIHIQKYMTYNPYLTMSILSLKKNISIQVKYNPKTYREIKATEHNENLKVEKHHLMVSQSNLKWYVLLLLRWSQNFFDLKEDNQFWYFMIHPRLCNRQGSFYFLKMGPQFYFQCSNLIICLTKDDPGKHEQTDMLFCLGLTNNSLIREIQPACMPSGVWGFPQKYFITISNHIEYNFS